MSVAISHVCVSFCFKLCRHLSTWYVFELQQFLDLVRITSDSTRWCKDYRRDLIRLDNQHKPSSFLFTDKYFLTCSLTCSLKPLLNLLTGGYCGELPIGDVFKSQIRK
jgi:hypothetical protein